MTTTKANKRINWVDVSRGLAFLMVIYYHLPMMDSGVMNFFQPVFLTTFFFISGYLFKGGQPFLKILEQRTRTLLVPFLILGFVMIGMSQVLTFNAPASFTNDVKGMLLQNGDNEILWFIAALFVYSVIFYWIDRLCSTPLMLMVVSVILFAVNSLALHHWGVGPVYWHVECFGCACFYMAAGRIYRIYEQKIDSHVSFWIVAVLALLYSIYIMWSGTGYGHTGSYYIIDSMAITLAGLVLIIAISKRIFHNSRFLLFVGANTLVYFAFHGKAYSLILTLGRRMWPQVIESGDFTTDIIVAAAVVLLDAVILIPVSMAINRYIPHILGRNFTLWHTGDESRHNKSMETDVNK